MLLTIASLSGNGFTCRETIQSIAKRHGKSTHRSTVRSGISRLEDMGLVSRSSETGFITVNIDKIRQIVNGGKTAIRTNVMAENPPLDGGKSATDGGKSATANERKSAEYLYSSDMVGHIPIHGLYIDPNNNNNNIIRLTSVFSEHVKREPDKDELGILVRLDYKKWEIIFSRSKKSGRDLESVTYMNRYLSTCVLNEFRKKAKRRRRKNEGTDSWYD